MHPVRAISDWIFGFDVFISYSREDGSAYASKLEEELNRIGFRAFLDSKEMPPGEALTPSLRSALARSSALVLVVSPGGLKSTYMPKEFDHYGNERRGKQKIIPISIGRTLDDAALTLPLVERVRSRADVIWISEDAGRLARGPSAKTFKSLLDGFRFTRRNTIRRRVISAACALLSVLLVVAVVAAKLATERAEIALSRQLVAQARDRLPSQPDLALLLAAQAHTIAPTTESIAGLSGTLGSLAQLTGHEHQSGGAVERMAYSNDGRHFAVLGPEGLKIWKTSPRTLLATLQDSDSSLTSFAFHPDGTRLVTSSGEKRVTLWQLAVPQAPEVKIPLKNVVRVSFAPDGRQVLAGTGDGHIFLIDPQEGSPRDLGEVHRGFITAIIPDFARGKFYTAGMSGSRNVAAWDFATLQRERYFEGHRMSVNALGLSHDGSKLASAGEERFVIVWDAASGEPRTQLASTANPVWKYGAPEPHGTGALDLAFIPDDSELLAAYDDGRVLVWNLATRKGGEIRAHLGAASALAMQPDSRSFASGGMDGKVRFWDLGQIHPAARILAAGAGSRVMGFSAKGDFISVVGDQEIRRWSVATGKEGPPARWTPEPSMEVIAFTASGNLLALGTGDRSKPGVVIRRGANYDEVLRLPDAFGEAGLAAFDPQGKWFASRATPSGLRIWSLKDPALHARPCDEDPAALEALAFSADGTWLLAAGRDSPLMLWNPGSGRVIARLESPADLRAPTAVAGHAGQQTVAAGYLQHGTIAFWDLRDPSLPRLTAITHEHSSHSSITLLAYSMDGTRMLSLGSEGDAVLWQLPEAAPLARFENFGSGYARCLPFNDKGTLAACSTTEGLTLFDLSPPDWKRLAASLAGRPLSEAERQVFVQPGH